MNKIQQIKKWIRDNSESGWTSGEGGKFEDRFDGLRKILGMPRGEEALCWEWNKYHAKK